jgi:hypothetical protein
MQVGIVGKTSMLRPIIHIMHTVRKGVYMDICVPIHVYICLNICIYINIHIFSTCQSGKSSYSMLLSLDTDQVSCLQLYIYIYRYMS